MFRPLLNLSKRSSLSAPATRVLCLSSSSTNPAPSPLVPADLYSHPDPVLFSEPDFPQLPQFGNGHVASVSLAGPPNAGKSSLSNALIEHRISAVSRKVNTTRSCPTGVYTRQKRQNNLSRQLLLCDTPGLVERAFLASLGGERRTISTAAWGTALETDFALFIVDATRSKKYFDYYAHIASQLANFRHNHFTGVQQTYSDAQQNGSVEEDEEPQKPAIVENQPPGNCILVLNKSDVVRPSIKVLAVEDYLTNTIADFGTRFHSKVFVTSAFRNEGVEELRNYLLDAAPSSELVAPPGLSYLDNDLDLIRQHIWEKLLHRVHQEIPYKCKFENIDIYTAKDELYVSEVIRAPSKSACYVIVGQGGDVLRWIKESAEHSASEVLGKKVNLKLKVTYEKRKHARTRSN